MPFNVGPLELVIVLVIALLVIGPRRLPEMGNAVGKTIREFRKASSDISEAATLEPDSKPASGDAPTTAPPAERPPASPADEPPAAPAAPAAPADEPPAAPASAEHAAERKSDA